MINIKNINYQPSIDELSDYIQNPLFEVFLEYLNKKYQAIISVEYSKDVWLQGWNIKFRKAGRGLCVIYPKDKYFTVLVVIGKKEKERFENDFYRYTKVIKDIYHSAKEGNGQRWLMIDLYRTDEVYHDVLKLIQIRRDSK